FFFSSRRRHTRSKRDWSSDVCSSDLSLWSATMAPLPDRSGRELPDTTDVVVIGGGYTGINAARELARAGSAVTLLEAHTLGFGRSEERRVGKECRSRWSAYH